MDPDRLDYPRIVQDALRDAVRRVLAQVSEHGLPGEHHFFVAFRTGYHGVVVPAFLRDLYPEEIKIIVQHQYWDLAVDEEAFGITLSFGGTRHRLTVPLAALTVFADPTAEFMLRFDGGGAAEDVEDAKDSKDVKAVEAVADRAPAAGEVLRFDPRRRK